ncbi:uncharacterized protein LY89DRAFT_612885 [Mollisia scopiformis]|uniref:Uncharacterized protein n=1 Tax=Mollisia scopiformis TaxID=149040 RepID=A0A194XGI4_MOLSC|nr:uncharacterized protein LY89DRAFT_612885 [Mollisia scopiformis]KUJ19278.1 hypothetical protein LY89DRAFT_612885 [Mollisia scopiformis]
MPTNPMPRSLTSRVLSTISLRPLGSKSSSNMALSTHQIEVYEDCISKLRTEIFKLEDQQTKLLSALIIISRCIKSDLAPSRNYKPFPFADEEDEKELLCSIDDHIEYLAAELQQIQNRVWKTSFQPSRSGRPGKVPESERRILPPTSIIEDFSKPQLQLVIDLGQLIVKKAELMVWSDLLEGNLVFWSNVWKEVQKGRKLKDCRCDRLRPPFSEGHKIKDDIPISPRSSVRPSLTRSNAVRCTKNGRIRRKEVPVQELIDRFLKKVGDGDGEESKRDDERHDSAISMDIDGHKSNGHNSVNDLAIVKQDSGVDVGEGDGKGEGRLRRKSA